MKIKTIWLGKKYFFHGFMFLVPELEKVTTQF